MTDHTLVRPLFAGPLDVVGDVHGEIDALRSLLSVLGYRPDGTHPANRRLVFVGDLCDRGPDSPAVIELVQGLVERQLAQCLLGNHELNILRGDAKHGNRWFLDPEHEEQRNEFAASKPVPDQTSKRRWAEFFRTLPVALERPDLRVVHAAWHSPSIEALRNVKEPAITAFERFEDTVKDDLAKTGLAAAAKTEKAAHLLSDSSRPPPLLEKLGRYDETKQCRNPLRVVTSGMERLTTNPFWANGSWRMCDRVKWWDEYDEDTPVIFGHYWRGSSESEGDVSGGKPDLFEGLGHDQWSGQKQKQNLFCVDFSVGGRYRERRRNAASFTTRLAAVRWPEREIVFDT